jgi:hypothetical protein
MKQVLSETLAKSVREGALIAGAGVATEKTVNGLLNVSKEEPKTIKKFLGIVALLTGVVGLLTTWIIKRKGESDAIKYEREREADAALYERQRLADSRQTERECEAESDSYTVRRMADERHRVKSDDRRTAETPTPNDGINPENDGNEDEEQEDRTTWLEKFKSQFTMPELPPFLAKIMSGVPQGYEEAMLLHMLAMLGAMCFSKVRSVYLDGIAHAANLQVVVEGNWGTGKAKFEQLFKVLFSRIISSCKNKIDLLSDPDNRIPLIVQTTGIGTSMSKYVDILADNQGCHMYIFNSEVRALFYDLKKGNGLNFDFLRKAFENGDVCRNNKARDSKNGIFPIYLNYTLTGTPADINTSFKKELEGGTLSRIAWTCIPEAGRYPGILRLPEGNELEALKDQIDDWTEAYCYQRIPCEGDEAVGEVNVDLDYVCKALKDWNDRQFQLAEEEKNPARKDVRMRMAAIAFHCSIVIHMLYDNPAPANWQKRQKVVDLTLFIADYCIERFLHKFGKAQNLQRRANKEAEYVEDDTPQAEQNGNSSASSASQKITDIAELKRLHDKKDAKGQSLYGWDTLAGMSGMSASTVRKKIKAYEASLGQS